MFLYFFLCPCAVLKEEFHTCQIAQALKMFVFRKEYLICQACRLFAAGKQEGGAAVGKIANQMMDSLCFSFIFPQALYDAS